jgi:hypothetical protein
VRAHSAASGRGLTRFRHEIGKLVLAEADQSQVETVAVERGQFRRKDAFVPSGIERQAFVGQDVGAPLRLAKVIEHDHRHLGQAELARRQQPPVSGNDAVAGIHQNRIHETKLRDRSGDLRHLVGRVRPRVPRVWHQALEGPKLDAPRHRRRHTISY